MATTPRRRGPPGPGITVRPGAERDRTTSAWLDSRHTFAFGAYDRVWSGLGPLKVLNEDRIAPGGAFGLHPHWDMEIVTFVLAGELTHEDSLGHRATLRVGEVQHISAGTGIEHAERNASLTESVHLFQVWITPSCKGLFPRYQQVPAPGGDGLGLVAGPASTGAPIALQQDVEIYRGVVSVRRTLSHVLRDGHTIWLQVARGAVAVGSQQLGAGDGAAIIGQKGVQVVTEGDAWFLLFDLGRS